MLRKIPATMTKAECTIPPVICSQLQFALGRRPDDWPWPLPKLSAASNAEACRGGKGKGKEQAPVGPDRGSKVPRTARDASGQARLLDFGWEYCAGKGQAQPDSSRHLNVVQFVEMGRCWHVWCSQSLSFFQVLALGRRSLLAKVQLLHYFSQKYLYSKFLRNCFLEH